MYKGQSHVRHGHGHHHGHGHGNSLENKSEHSMHREPKYDRPHTERHREVERQRQEARAQREKVAKHVSDAKMEQQPSVYGVIRKSPPNNHSFNDSVNKILQNVLGDFDSFTPHENKLGVMGICQQPQTPVKAGPLIDDEAGFEYSPERPPQLGSGNGPWTTKPWPSGAGPSSSSSHRTSSSHGHVTSNRSSSSSSGHHAPGLKPDEGKRSKSQSVSSSAAGPGRGQARDPEVSEIMNLFDDVKAPLPGLLQTPRPDHQSPFVFPSAVPSRDRDPAPPPPPTPTNGIRNQSASGHSKSGRSSEAKVRQSRPDVGLISDHHRSEKVAALVSENHMPECNGITNGMNSSGALSGNPSSSLRALDDEYESKSVFSAYKSSEESSNSEDSSGSESEESSSSGEEKPGCNASDGNKWSLTNIFNRTNVPSKNSADIYKEDLHSGSNEPTPPIATTIISRNRRSNEVKYNTLAPHALSEDSSDHEVRPHTKSRKQQKATSESSSHHHRRGRPVKSQPIISSDSEDDTESVPHKRLDSKKDLSTDHRRSSKSSYPPVTNGTSHSSKKSQKKKDNKKADVATDRRDSRYEQQQHRQLMASDIDSDSSIDIINSSPEKKAKNKRPSKKACPITKKSPKGFVSPSQASVALKKNVRGPSNTASQVAIAAVKSSNGAREDKENAKIKAKIPDVAEKVSVKEKVSSRKKHEEFPSSKRAKRSHEKGIESHKRDATDTTNLALDSRLREIPRSTSPLCPPGYQDSKKLHTKLPLNNIHYENGVPKIVCCIPLNLIDSLPDSNASVKSSLKKDKVNKEVLEMRTNHKSNFRECKSPSSEDNKKKRAICSIYGKRQSSVERDRVKKEIKMEVSEPEEVKVPIDHVNMSETKDKTTASPAASTVDSYNGKHKKERRKTKNQEESSLKKPVKVIVNEAPTAKEFSSESSPNVQVTTKRPRERDNSVESGKSRSKAGAGGSLSQPSKKLKVSAEDGRKSSSPRDIKSSPSVREFAMPAAHSSVDRPSSAVVASNNTNSLPPPQTNQPHPKQKSSQSSSQYSQKASENCHPAARQNEELPGNKHQRSSVNKEKPCGDENDTASCFDLGPAEEYHDSKVRGRISPSVSSQPYPPPPPPPAPSKNRLLHHAPVAPSAAAVNHLLLSNNSSGVVPVPGYFISYFERRAPELVNTDCNDFIERGKDKKHLADEETNRPLKVILYLEAVLYFILSGVSTSEGQQNSVDATYKLYNDTHSLVRHVSDILFHRAALREEESVFLKLKILSLRCQSLLHLKLHLLKRLEATKLEEHLNAYFRNTADKHTHVAHPSTAAAATVGGGGGGATPNAPAAAVATLNSSGNNWGGPNQRNHASTSPSLSPTPSPAESVGSEGSQTSSGYSTSTPPQVLQMVSLPTEIHQMIFRHYGLHGNLSKAFDMWMEGDEFVVSDEDVKQYFVKLDHSCGPLTLHSSLLELVAYMQVALHELKKEL